MLAHDAGGPLPAEVGELEVAVTGDGEQTVALHPRDGLRHRGAGLPEAFGDPRPQRDDPLLLELVDRAQVHLRRIDQVAHASRPPSAGTPATIVRPATPGTYRFPAREQRTRRLRSRSW